jgi:hypothetical protein
MDDVKKVSGFIDFLEGVFEECNKARIDRNVQVWYDLLIVATINLSTEMSNAQLVSCKNFKSGLFKDVQSIEVGMDAEHNFVIPLSLEERLFDWEILLRKIRRDASLQHNLRDDRRRFT